MLVICSLVLICDILKELMSKVLDTSTKVHIFTHKNITSHEYHKTKGIDVVVLYNLVY